MDKQDITLRCQQYSGPGGSCVTASDIDAYMVREDHVYLRNPANLNSRG